MISNNNMKYFILYKASAKNLGQVENLKYFNSYNQARDELLAYVSNNKSDVSMDLDIKENIIKIYEKNNEIQKNFIVNKIMKLERIKGVKYIKNKTKEEIKYGCLLEYPENVIYVWKNNNNIYEIYAKIDVSGIFTTKYILTQLHEFDTTRELIILDNINYNELKNNKNYSDGFYICNNIKDNSIILYEKYEIIKNILHSSLSAIIGINSININDHDLLCKNKSSFPLNKPSLTKPPLPLNKPSLSKPPVPLNKPPPVPLNKPPPVPRKSMFDNNNDKKKIYTPSLSQIEECIKKLKPVEIIKEKKVYGTNFLIDEMKTNFNEILKSDKIIKPSNMKKSLNPKSLKNIIEPEQDLMKINNDELFENLIKECVDQDFNEYLNIKKFNNNNILNKKTNDLTNKYNISNCNRYESIYEESKINPRDEELFEKLPEESSHISESYDSESNDNDSELSDDKSYNDSELTDDESYNDWEDFEVEIKMPEGSLIQLKNSNDDQEIDNNEDLLEDSDNDQEIDNNQYLLEDSDNDQELDNNQDLLEDSDDDDQELDNNEDLLEDSDDQELDNNDLLEDPDNYLELDNNEDLLQDSNNQRLDNDEDLLEDPDNYLELDNNEDLTDDDNIQELDNNDLLEDSNDYEELNDKGTKSWNTQESLKHKSWNREESKKFNNRKYRLYNIDDIESDSDVELYIEDLNKNPEDVIDEQIKQLVCGLIKEIDEEMKEKKHSKKFISELIDCLNRLTELTVESEFETLEKIIDKIALEFDNQQFKNFTFDLIDFIFKLNKKQIKKLTSELIKEFGNENLNDEIEENLNDEIEENLNNETEENNFEDSFYDKIFDKKTMDNTINEVIYNKNDEKTDSETESCDSYYIYDDNIDDSNIEDEDNSWFEGEKTENLQGKTNVKKILETSDYEIIKNYI